MKQSIRVTSMYDYNFVVRTVVDVCAQILADDNSSTPSRGNHVDIIVKHFIIDNDRGCVYAKIDEKRNEIEAAKKIEKAYKLGRDNWHMHSAICPYKDTELRRAWLRGWKEARVEQREEEAAADAMISEQEF